MNAEIITVGTELLLGQILDTNSVYIGKTLAEAGIDLFYKTSVGDNVPRLKSAIEAACARAEIVIITGGLGPTVDDITREAIAEVTGKALVLDASLLKQIKSFFEKRNLLMTESNQVQAYLPEGAGIIENKNGTAPGFIMAHSGNTIIAMPGVPHEMHAMMENSVMPYLYEKMGGTVFSIKSKTLHIGGMSESAVNNKIEDLFINSKNPSIGILAHWTHIDLRLTVKTDSQKNADKVLNELKEKIYERLGGNIFGEDEETIELAVSKLLMAKHLTLSTAESCTAGLLSYKLTNMAGASGFFMGGVSVYSNEIKTSILGVNEKVISEFGAVSAETACEMATKCREKFKTDIGVAITGIAGPEGGTQSKPVGLVYVALDIKGKVQFFENRFGTGREIVRSRAAQVALFKLYTALKNS